MEILSKQKKTLVLDDYGSMSSIVDEILIYGDFNRCIIHDTNSLYPKARSVNPDLIIMDHLLLNSECQQNCHELKRDEQLANIPVIIIVGHLIRKVRSDAFICDAILVKPLDIELLAPQIGYLTAS